MRRRDFIAGLGSLLIPGLIGIGGAQSASPFRIGILRGGSVTAQTERFKSRLGELGYSEGRDYVLDIRNHEGRLERLPDLANRLVQAKPNLIVAVGPEA